MEDEPPLGAEHHLAGSTGEGEPSGFADSRHPVARAGVSFGAEAGGVLAVAEKVPLAVAELCLGRQVPRLQVVDVHLGDGSAIAQVV